jgi:hypothetical protein
MPRGTAHTGYYPCLITRHHFSLPTIEMSAHYMERWYRVGAPRNTNIGRMSRRTKLETMHVVTLNRTHERPTTCLPTWYVP